MLPKALTRFRAAVAMGRRPGVLQSRATDDTGMCSRRAQADRGERGRWANYHYNASRAGASTPTGEVNHVYA